MNYRCLSVCGQDNFLTQIPHLLSQIGLKTATFKLSTSYILLWGPIFGVGGGLNLKAD